MLCPNKPRQIAKFWAADFAAFEVHRQTVTRPRRNARPQPASFYKPAPRNGTRVAEYARRTERRGVGLPGSLRAARSRRTPAGTAARAVLRQCTP
jgi:hypothetical protein